MEINEAGDTVWTSAYGGSRSEWSSAVLAIEHNGYVLAGRAQRDDVASDLQFQIVRLGTIQAATAPRIRQFTISLEQNHPNPFNSTTQIEFTLPSTQRVSLKLYDVLGREVAVMVNQVETAGRHHMTFDASGLPSGVYLCRLEAGEMAQTRKMVLIK
jgi:hypothetical protein